MNDAPPLDLALVRSTLPLVRRDFPVFEHAFHARLPDAALHVRRLTGRALEAAMTAALADLDASGPSALERRHAAFRAVSVHRDAVREALAHALRVTLGASCTNDVIAAWTAAYDRFTLAPPAKSYGRGLR